MNTSRIGIRTASPATGLRSIGLILVLSLLVLLAAYTVQLGTIPVVVFVAAILAPAILFMPVAPLVNLILAMAFVVSGSLIFFAGLKTASWIPYLLCMLLTFRVLGQSVRASVAERSELMRTGMPAFMVALIAFFILVVLASAANKVGFGFWVLAFKNYFSVWLLLFLLWKNKEFSPHWMPTWRALLWVAVIQVPVAIFQRIKSATGSPYSNLNWDAIVGTFGGDPDGSGLSGALGLFMIFAALMAGSLWRCGKLDTREFVLVVASSILVIGLAEVKAAVVLLPIAAFYLFRDLPVRQPRQFLLGLLLTGFLVFGLLYAYYLMYVSKSGVDHGLIDTLIEKFTGAFFDPYFIDRTTGEVGRIPSVRLWWSGNSGDLYSLLFGHGPMAVRISSVFGPGSVIRTFTVNIGMYSLPVFLWELGILAVGAFLLSLFMAMKSAYRLVSDQAIPDEHRAILNASAFCIFMIALFLPYNRDMIDSAAIQCLLALFYAYVAYWWRRTPPRGLSQFSAAVDRGAIAHSGRTFTH